MFSRCLLHTVRAETVSLCTFLNRCATILDVVWRSFKTEISLIDLPVLWYTSFSQNLDSCYKNQFPELVLTHHALYFLLNLRYFIIMKSLTTSSGLILHMQKLQHQINFGMTLTIMAVVMVTS